MLKIQPFHKVGNICIDDNITSVSNYFNKNYIYMYANGLSFTYTLMIVPGESVLNKIRTTCIYPTYDYLEDFVGLHIEERLRSDFLKDEFVPFIKKNLEDNIPVCVFLDAYCIPWNVKCYQKFHTPHSFLVVDINEEEETISCIDGFLTDKIEVLDFDNLFIFTSVITIKSIPQRVKASFHNIMQQIVNGLRDNNKLDNCDSIRSFSFDVQKIIFTDEEKIIYKELENSQFLFGIKSIEYGRKNLANMFYYMSNQFPDKKELLLLLQSKLNAIAEQWSLVNIYLIKGFYSNQSTHYVNKAADLLINIAKNEENVTQLLVNSYE